SDPDRVGSLRTECQCSQYCGGQGAYSESLIFTDAANCATGITVSHRCGGTQSMKIATVTLNPAIDQTVRVDHFRPNAVNYAQTMHFDAGGKGINVASFLADAGFFPTVTGFLGQDNADIFEQFFASKNLNDQFVRIPGRTRIGVKIVDEVNQQTTDINMPG